MSGFVLHPDALTDLDEIWEYIAADNPGAADRVLGECMNRFAPLFAFLKRAIAAPISLRDRCGFILYGIL
jgi:plasmid stabilization system protein ParE